jgi:hypothetical protein
MVQVSALREVKERSEEQEKDLEHLLRVTEIDHFGLIHLAVYPLVPREYVAPEVEAENVEAENVEAEIVEE